MKPCHRMRFLHRASPGLHRFEAPPPNGLHHSVPNGVTHSVPNCLLHSVPNGLLHSVPNGACHSGFLPPCPLPIGIQASDLTFVIRAKIALQLKGIKYEFLEEAYGAKSELLLKSNPVYKKIPVLIHNGKPVCESMIIVQYIEDVWPNKGVSLLPSDPYDRAAARFWAVYIDDKIFPSIRGIGMAQTEEAKVEATSQLNAGLQLLEEAYVKAAKGKKFFNGDNIGYLDIAFGCFIGLIKATEKINEIKLLDVEKIPNLASWVERFCADEAVKEALPETERVVEFIKMIQARFKNAPPPTK